MAFKTIKIPEGDAVAVYADGVLLWEAAEQLNPPSIYIGGDYLYINEIDGRTQLFSIFANGVKVITIEYANSGQTTIELKDNDKGGTTMIVSTTEYEVTEDGTIIIGKAQPEGE